MEGEERTTQLRVACLGSWENVSMYTKRGLRGGDEVAFLTRDFLTKGPLSGDVQGRVRSSELMI